MVEKAWHQTLWVILYVPLSIQYILCKVADMLISLNQKSAQLACLGIISARLTPPPTTIQTESYMNMITTQIQSFKPLLYIHIISILFDYHVYRLLSMDALCSTSFTALNTLDIQFNMISHLPVSCLRDSSSNVAVNLNSNALGSVDDCWFR